MRPRRSWRETRRQRCLKNAKAEVETTNQKAKLDNFRLRRADVRTLLELVTGLI